MAYEKTNWKARQGTGLNKFTKSVETATSVVLANTPDSVTDPGTPFSAANMNKIEEGIFQAHEGVAAEAAARQRGDETLAQAISSLTKSDVGLGSVTDDAQVKRSEMGEPNGVAALDGEGKVPLDQLPKFMSGEGDSEALARANAYTDEKLAFKADLDSPALAGTPTAPTAAQAVNNAQIATTAYVQNSQRDFPLAADCDDTALLHNKIYRTGGSTLNCPVSGSIGWLLNLQGSQTNNKIQFWWRYRDNQTFHRNRNAVSPGPDYKWNDWAQYAFLNSPSFTGIPKIPNKTSPATNNGTLIASEDQVSQLMRRGLSTQTYTVALADLQATIDSLPRLLNRNVTINVQAGSLPNNTITISRFFGQGILTVRAVDGAGAQVTTTVTTHSVKNIVVDHNALPQITIIGFRCMNNANSTSPADSGIGGAYNNDVRLELCTINSSPLFGDGILFETTKHAHVINCAVGSKAYYFRMNFGTMICENNAVQSVAVNSIIYRTSSGVLMVRSEGSMAAIPAGAWRYSAVLNGFIVNNEKIIFSETN